MFLGEYRHQTDEKFRLRVPAKLKPTLGNSYVVTKGTSGCLFVFSKELLQTSFFDKLKNISLFDEAAQRPIRMLLSSAFECEEDAQGRFLLPKALRDFANITKDVVFIGAGNHIELWDAQAFDEYINNGGDFDKLVSGLKDYGI